MKLGFIGAGEMGGALIRGLLKAGYDKNDILVSVRTVEKANLLSATLGIAAYTDNQRVIAQADRLFLAVKPAQMPQILEEISKAGVAPKPLISMALGWTVEKIQRTLPNWPVIRIMPNMPLCMGKGITLLQFAGQVLPEVRQAVSSLFNTMGRTYEIPASMFETATALSGSGPAFVYQFIDALARAAEQNGLDTDTARALAIYTVQGAAELAAQAAVTPAQLVSQVATPGGCTAAGMDLLKTSDFDQVLEQAIRATAQKAREVCNS